MRVALAACLFSMVGIGCSDSDAEKNDTEPKSNTVAESGAAQETGAPTESVAVTGAESGTGTGTESVTETDVANGSEVPTALNVGDSPPAFTLRDQNDEAVEFAAIIQKRKATAFVFYRSADW